MIHRLSSLAAIFVLIAGLFGAAALPASAAPLPEPSSPPRAEEPHSFWVFLVDPRSQEAAEPGAFEAAFAPLHDLLEQARQDSSLTGYTPIPDGFVVRLDGPTPRLLQQISELSGVEAVLSEELGLDEMLTDRFADATDRDQQPAGADIPSQAPAQPGSLTPPAGAPLSALLPGKFSVYLYTSSIDGYAVVPGNTVRIVLTRAGETLADRTVPSDATYGIYSAYLSLPYSARYGIEPGDIITVTETGQPDNIMTMPEAWVTINTVTDTVAGKVFPGAPVQFRIGSTLYDATGGTDGAFSLHSGTDITRFSGTMYVFTTDPVSSNEIILSGYAPSFDARLNDNMGACGNPGKWGLPDPITVNRYIDGQLTDTAEAEFDFVNSFCADISDLQPGQRLTAQMPGGETLDFTIPPFSFTMSGTDNTLIGTALPDTLVNGYLIDYSAMDNYLISFLTDSAGSFHYDVTEFDLTGQDQATLYYQTSEGHMVLLTGRVASVGINLAGYDFFLRGTANEHYAAQLISPEGQVLNSLTGTIASYGYSTFSFPGPNTDEAYQFSPGDRLLINNLASQVLIDLIIPPLQITPDVETDRVRIETVPGRAVELTLEQAGLAGDSYGYFFATTDSGGVSVIDMAPKDLKYSDRLSVHASLAEGNSLEAFLVIGNRVMINETEDYARIWTNSYADLTAQLLSPSGAVKRTANIRATSDGFAFLGTLGDMVPGDTLRLTGTGQTTEIPVRALSILVVDRTGNSLTGKTDPSLEVAGSTMNSSPVFGLADDAGSFTLDFSGGMRPLMGRERLSVRVFDRTTGATQILDGYVPYVELAWSENMLSGWAPQGTSVAASLYDNAGNLKETLVTGTYGDYFQNWSVLFSRTVAPGDRFKVILGGTQTLELTPPALELNYTVDTDILSGSGPTGEVVSLSASKSMGTSYNYYEDEITIGAGGNFTVDLSDEIDINALTWLGVEWRSSIGDGVYLEKQVPGLRIWIDDLYAAYMDSGLGEQVTFRLMNAAGALKGEQTVISYTDGAELEGMCAAGKPLAYLPGDTLEAVGNGVSAIIPDLKAEIDMSRDQILVSGPAGASVSVIMYRPYGIYGLDYIYITETKLDKSGNKVLDPELEILPGDFLNLYWEDAEGNMLVKTSSTIDANSLSARLSGYPDTARPHSAVTIDWEILSNFGSLGSYGIYFDTQSHGCDHNYRNYYWSYRLTGNSGKSQIETPAGGTLYVSMLTSISGRPVWAPEIAIKVADIVPVIVEPVSGVTNQRQPLIYGYAAPGARVEVFDGTTQLDSLTADEEGYWETQVITPLAKGAHILQIRAGGRSSAPVLLDVQPGLWIDPNRVRFSNLDADYIPRDAQGYADLGGSMWVRPGAQFEVSIPVRCPTPSQMPLKASLLAGDAVYPLYYSYGTWQTVINTPADDSQVSARLQCGAETRTILLANTLVYTDGYIASQDGRRVDNAQVTLLKKDPQTGEFYFWDAVTWNQYNPRYSTDDGWYDFQPEPGVYRLLVEDDDDHEPYTSPDITVTSGPIRYNVFLVGTNPVWLFMPMVGYRK